MMTETNSPHTPEIQQLVEAYYTDYYREQLGLPDWENRVNNRVHETDFFADPKIKKFERWCNVNLDANWRVLIVGAGTGAEFLQLSSKGCDVVGIEPDENACMIGKRLAEQHGIDPQKFQQGIGEDMPYSDGEFDLIWCHTVLEHVQNVDDTVSEIIRVMKPDGYAFIVTPDYRQWYEPHYKLPLPMFLPKILIKAYLALIGRPSHFIDTLQFVTQKQLANLFQNYPVESLQVYHPWPDSWKKNPNWEQRAIKFLTRTFSWQRDQYWILRKLR